MLQQTIHLSRLSQHDLDPNRMNHSDVRFKQPSACTIQGTKDKVEVQEGITERREKLAGGAF